MDWTIGPFFGLFFGPFLGLNFGLFFKGRVGSLVRGWWVGGFCQLNYIIQYSSKRTLVLLHMITHLNRLKYGLDHWTLGPLDYFLDYFLDHVVLCCKEKLEPLIKSCFGIF